MPRSPKGERPPVDAIGHAVMITKIAIGEIEDITTEDGKNAAAVALGRMGGCPPVNAKKLPKTPLQTAGRIGT
jgi:hypothetical protein